jgi:hypothetical protein
MKLLSKKKGGGTVSTVSTQSTPHPRAKITPAGKSPCEVARELRDQALRSDCGRSLTWECERRGLLTLDELQLLLSRLDLGETGNPVSAAESTLMDHGPCAPLIPRLCALREGDPIHRYYRPLRAPVSV